MSGARRSGSGSATQIGSRLVGVLYILDEPSIGLHQRDNARLLATLARLRDLGNTVIVVEHDEETMRAADYLIDMGPGRGSTAGLVVAEGTVEQVMANPASIDGAVSHGRLSIPVPAVRRARGSGAHAPDRRRARAQPPQRVGRHSTGVLRRGDRACRGRGSRR